MLEKTTIEITVDKKNLGKKISVSKPVISTSCAYLYEDGYPTMKITKQRLKQIIKEELNRLHEIDDPLSSRGLPRSREIDRLRDIGASTVGKGGFAPPGPLPSDGEGDDSDEEPKTLPKQVLDLAAAIRGAGDPPRDEQKFEVLHAAYQDLLRAIYESGLRVSSLIPWDAE